MRSCSPVAGDFFYDHTRSNDTPDQLQFEFTMEVLRSLQRQELCNETVDGTSETDTWNVVQAFFRIKKLSSAN